MGAALLPSNQSHNHMANVRIMCMHFSFQKHFYSLGIEYVSQPHFEASVRMRLTFPKVGTWSPSRFPQLQISMAEVKTPRLEVFFIPSERP